MMYMFRLFRCFVLQYLSYITQHFPAYSVFISAAPEPAAASSRSEDGVKIPVVSGKMSLDNDSLYFTQF